MIENKFKWLLDEEHPRILREALNLYGTKEKLGVQNNPVIMNWAEELKPFLGGEYRNDSDAWCGLFMGICAKRAGFTPPNICIRARSWVNFGRNIQGAMLGDILIFMRKSGGHVGLYVAEDADRFYVLGGNQGDQVCIVPIEKARILAVRRCAYGTQPPNIRKIFINADKKSSQNEG